MLDEVKRSKEKTQMMKEKETTCQKAGQEECAVLRKKGEKLTVLNASINR